MLLGMARSLKQVEKSNFEIGDLVRIKEGTHQDEIEHRTIYEVQMGRSVLNFHQMFLEKLST